MNRFKFLFNTVFLNIIKQAETFGTAEKHSIRSLMFPGTGAAAAPAAAATAAAAAPAGGEGDEFGFDFMEEEGGAASEAATEITEEDTFDLVPGDRCASETNKPLNPVGPAQQNAGQRIKTIPETNGCALKKYRALVVHDSFGAYLKPFLAESFGHVVFVNNRAQDSLKSIIETEEPDLFLEVVIERNIRSRMISPAVLNGE